MPREQLVPFHARADLLGPVEVKSVKEPNKGSAGSIIFRVLLATPEIKSGVAYFMTGNCARFNVGSEANLLLEPESRQAHFV